MVQISITYDLANPGGSQAPETNAGRLADMRRRAMRFASPLREIVQEIPDDAEASEVRLADWDLISWSDNQGRTTLVGDAAHPMTMCASLDSRLHFSTSKSKL